MAGVEGLQIAKKSLEAQKMLDARRSLRVKSAWDPRRYESTRYLHETGRGTLEKQGMALREAKKPETGFYSTYDERLSHVPIGLPDQGAWLGRRGESVFVPTPATEEGRAAREKLAEKGMDGILYQNAEPDFSKCAEATVRIDRMTERRPDNFAQADIKCAEQWNQTRMEGRDDWTAREVRQWRDAHNCSWHERCDTQTMDLVPREIHSYFSHSGGVSECRIRDAAGNGGIFDE